MNFIKNLFVPKTREVGLNLSNNYRLAFVIPTRKPSKKTVQLVSDLINYNQQVDVYVVDDQTPSGWEDIFNAIAAIDPTRVFLLRNPIHTYKAGAINYGLRCIYNNGREYAGIAVSDDDVKINAFTVPFLVKCLFGQSRLGAVCPITHVENKNKNLLTRLQGLEYYNFNVIRMADLGFLQGPLVMPGMLTLYKTTALRRTGFFSQTSLIEDYDFTVNLKKNKYTVGLATFAHAWTSVPESFGQLWRQRVRWFYGGLTVLAAKPPLMTVFQDVLGHLLFLTVFVLVVASFLFNSQDSYQVLGYAVLGISLAGWALMHLFQLLLMLEYQGTDVWDWLLKSLVFPEFIYYQINTLVLVGSYLYFVFNLINRRIPYILTRRLNQSFAFFGFTQTWGTR